MREDGGDVSAGGGTGKREEGRVYGEGIVSWVGEDGEECGLTVVGGGGVGVFGCETGERVLERGCFTGEFVLRMLWAELFLGTKIPCHDHLIISRISEETKGELDAYR